MVLSPTLARSHFDLARAALEWDIKSTLTRLLNNIFQNTGQKLDGLILSKKEMKRKKVTTQIL